MRKHLDTYLKGILAGMMIGVGGTLSLSVDNKYIGSFLFAIGLFLIFSYKFNLFTGKVGYLINNKLPYALDLGIIWLGNLTGAIFVGLMMLLTRSNISEKASAMCKIKLNDNLLSIFVLSMFCGMLMFVAADNFLNAKNDIQKYLAVFLPVMVFILSGFEHCVANMYYFTIGKAWSLNTILYLVVMSLGNACGSFIIPLFYKVIKEK